MNEEFNDCSNANSNHQNKKCEMKIVKENRVLSGLNKLVTCINMYVIIVI